MLLPPPRSTLFPYTTLFRSILVRPVPAGAYLQGDRHIDCGNHCLDRKSTRLNSSHVKISYAVFCLKKKKLRIEFSMCFSLVYTFGTNWIKGYFQLPVSDTII